MDGAVDEARINAHVNARVLIERGLRVPIVTRITGLSSSIVRQVYREVTGQLAKPGPIPASMSLIETNTIRAATSVYLSLYARYAPNTIKHLEVDWRAVLLAYDAFSRIVPEQVHLLEVNAAWVAATGYRSQNLELERCKHCSALYVTCTAYERRIFTSCPMCALRDAQQKKRQRNRHVV